MSSNFYKLIGNAELWHNLVNDCLTKKIIHAYIFTGPKGVGKATMAKDFIKYIVDADNIMAERIDDLSHMDLLYINKKDKNEIGIDAIRNLNEFISHTPSEGKHKFIIIDAADDLNRNASNALLKILEEPTKNTHIFLISHSLYKLLPTIRSRCRIMKFKPLNEREMKLACQIGDKQFLEELVAGSPGRAVGNQIYREIYDDLVEYIFNKDIQKFNKFTLDLGKSEEKWKAIKIIIEYILYHIVKISSNVDINTDQRLVKLASLKTVEQWFDLYDQTQQNFKQEEIFNLDKKMVIFSILNMMNC